MGDDLKGLVKLVLTKLPRELRDNIYSYIWYDAIGQVDYGKLSALIKNCPVANGDETNLCSYPVLTEIPPFAHKRVTGYKFVREPVEWLYGNHYGFIVNGSAGVEPFLSVDIFHVGLSPVNWCIQRLEVVFSVQTHGWDRQSNPCFIDQFRKFRNIDVRHDFNLLITFSACREPVFLFFNLRAMEHIAKKLHPILKDFEETMGIEVLIQNYHPLIGQEDLKAMMGASRREWKDYLRHYLQPKAHDRIEQMEAVRQSHDEC